MSHELVDLLLHAHRREMRARAAREAQWQKLAADVRERGHPWQRNVCDDPGRRIAILTGRGCGKTEAICERFLRRMMLTPRARCLYFATTREQVIDLLWEPFKSELERLGILDDCKLLEVPLRCRFPNGSAIHMVGADDMKSIEKHRGKPFHEVWIDEAASFPIQLLDHLMNRVIAPRLGDFGGILGLGGTPGHHLAGEFYEATRPGSEIHRHWEDRNKPEFAGWLNWSMHTWSQQDAAPHVEAIANVWEESQINKKAKDWSDDNPVYMREVLGKWAADDTDHVFRYRSHLDEGQEWNQWDPPKDPRTGVAILPDLGRREDWCYGWGVDLGFSDPLALEVFAWHPTDTSHQLFHVYELNKRELYAREFAELLIGRELNHDRPGGLVGATDWPNVTAVDDAGMGGSFIKELGEVYGIRLEEADKKNKFGDIEAFNGGLIDGRIKILKGSILESQLIHNQWSKDDFGQHKRNKGQRDDCVDAATYLHARAHHLLSREPEQPAARKLTEYHRAGAEVADEPRGEFDALFNDEIYTDDSLWG